MIVCPRCGSENEDPAMNWTVEKLARLAGQSRSAFSANFSNAMAMTPINYLLRYRMALAQRLLRETRISLAEVAARISDHFFDLLDGPVVRIGALDVPVPYAPVLVDQVFPTVEKILSGIRRILG